MHWVRLGKIFAPSGHEPWMRSHAAVPFAERVEGNNYAVYVSGRDAEGRSCTGILHVELEPTQRVIRVEPDALLLPGAPGTFDDAGAMLSWIVQSGGDRYFYYVGWNRGQNVPFRNAVGLAIQKRGERVLKWGGFTGHTSVLDPGPHDPSFTASCCVLVESDVWRMWYVSGLGWTREDGRMEPRYHLKYAESRDGIHWQRDGVVAIDFRHPSERAISRPCVVRDADTYRMWYSYRGERYAIGYAESADGLTWTRKDDVLGLSPSGVDWESDMVEYPHVFDHDGRRYMLYNGNGYGKSGLGLAVLRA
mgnify:CR=1 FL=1